MSDNYVLSLIERAATGGAFTGQQCFACGGDPTTGQGEHVIPRWVQKRFDLYNKSLTLLNGTRISYRHLTIPCCLSCNNGFLRDIENAVIRVLGRPNFKDPGVRLTLARWLCKIFIGILVKETTLLMDRSDPSGGPILSPDFLQEFMQAQFILQSARKPTEFHSMHGEHPFTVYMYRIHDDDGFGEFDLSTNLLGQSIAIRLGGIGAIFVNDGGLQAEVGPKGPLSLDGRRLHPIQFSEVAAWAHYNGTLRDATHSYTTFETADQIVIHQASVRPFTHLLVNGRQSRIFRPWDDIECAGLIERYRPVDWGPVYEPATGLFTTTLRNKRGGLPSPQTIFRGRWQLA